MKRLIGLISGAGLYFYCAQCVFAENSTISSYTSSTTQILTVIASASAVFFLIKGGYLYITSSGKPNALESAKRTIKNALIGLVLVLAASFVISSLATMFTNSAGDINNNAIRIQDIVPSKPTDGLTQVLLDAVNGFLQNLIQSAVQPIVSTVMTFLTTTPDLLSNSIIRNFWLVILGITDSLFVVVVALLGFHIMSSESFGFEQLSLKKLFPRIGLSFLGANISLFLCNYVIVTCNALVKAVIESTGGLNKAWISNLITVQSTPTLPLIVLLFLVIFLILAMVLLFLYVARLIFISLGAVLSPFIFLLWTLPKFEDFAVISIKSYFISVFTIFIHVVVIQLASSFLINPDQSGNSLLSITIGIGLFSVLLKIPQILIQLVFYTSGIKSINRFGGDIVNILSTSNLSTYTRNEVKREVLNSRKIIT